MEKPDTFVWVCSLAALALAAWAAFPVLGWELRRLVRLRRQRRRGGMV